MGKKKSEESGGKDNITVVLKADLHCEGCASKVSKCLYSLDGVDRVTICEDGQKITVIGKVDPVKLREKVERKTHKKFQLISPAPNKDKKVAEGKDEEEKDTKRKNKDKSKDNILKANKLPVTTTVFKLNVHCEGCIQKIQKIVTKTEGYQDMKIDKDKDLVTVTGSVDMKELAKILEQQLNKQVQIVPPKKDSDKKGKGGDGDGAGDHKTEQRYTQVQFGEPYWFTQGPGLAGAELMVDQYQYQYQHNPHAVHAPQIFSDENPNACSIM